MSANILGPLVQFGSLLNAALLAGALYGVFLYLNPAGLHAEAYRRQQQLGVRTLNTPMPRAWHH